MSEVSMVGQVALVTGGDMEPGTGRLDFEFATMRGELVRAPEMEDSEGFRPGDFRLLPVQVTAWGPLVFANLDLKASLATPPVPMTVMGLPHSVLMRATMPSIRAT